MAAGAAFLTWLVSLPLKNVSIVDGLWPVMFLVLGLSDALGFGRFNPRTVLVLVLLSLWSLRLSFHIIRRNLGHGEDRRYAAIRARNEPYFAFKSLYLVFALQALLAGVVSLPLFGALGSERPLGILDGLGALGWLIGFVFEAVGDWQLTRFKADPENRGRVMDQGLWRYTRHPNYFGDFAVWWGFYFMALGAGAAWTIVGPLVMSVLLMRVSGVTLLEKDIGERRPGYQDYIRRTNAFFPGPPDR